MARRLLATIIIALFLMTSAAPILSTLGNDDNYVTSTSPNLIDETWIGISTPEELSLIGSGGSYPANGKYYLEDDIIFTEGLDLNGGFDVMIELVITETYVKVKLSYAGTSIGIKSGSVMPIALNGVMREIPIGDSEVNFTLPSDLSLLKIVVGGVASNIPGTLDDSDPNFAIAVTFIPSTGVLAATVKSNGNMDPLSPSTNVFTGVFDGDGNAIIGLETTSYNNAGSAYAGLFAYMNTRADFFGVTMFSGSTVAIASSTASNSNAHAGGLLAYSTTYAASLKNCATMNGSVTAVSFEFHAYAGGLFGYVNLNLTADICINNKEVTSWAMRNAHAGGISSRANTMNLTNCFNAGAISSIRTESTNRAYSGGLVGYLNTTGGTSSITDSTNQGNVTSNFYSGGMVGYTAPALTITGSTSEVIVSGSIAGGLIGNAVGTPTIMNSNTAGTVNSTGQAGGLIGGATGPTITESSSACDVTSFVSTSNTLASGGLVGDITGGATITRSYSTGNVSSESPSGTWTGGIIGNSKGSVNMSYCYSTGHITGSGSSQQTNVGGLIGQVGSTSSLTRCYSTGNVNGTSALSPVNVGGLVGLIENATTEIKECFTTGDILATQIGTTSSAKNANAGGLVGRSYYNSSTSNLKISDCYTIGEISSFVEISGNALAGGIIGATENNASASNLFVSNCYSIGGITGMDKGGILGSGTTKVYITNCYFLEAGTLILCGAGTPVVDNSATTRAENPSGKLTSANLKIQSSYYDVNTDIGEVIIKGWDYSTVWGIDTAEVLNDGYPHLQWSFIFEQPKDIVVNVIAGSKISVTSYFVDPPAQWEKSSNGTDWDPITGATGLEYTATVNDHFDEMFRCVVGTMTSESAKILGIDLTIEISDGKLTYSGGEVITDTVMENVPVTSIEFTVVPDIGFALDKVILDSVDITDTLVDIFTVDTTSPHNLEVTFVSVALTYTVTASGGTGGTVGPASQTVVAGGDAPITITADSGNAVRKIFVDGDELEYFVLPFVLTDVNDDHVVYVEFALGYIITASVDGTNGSIDPMGSVPVMDGDTPMFTFYPNLYYEISEVLVDGSPVTVTDGTYTFPEIHDNHTIEVSFEESVFTIATDFNPDAGDVQLSSSTMTAFDTVTVTITPEAGYDFATPTTTSGTLTKVSETEYTLEGVTEDCTVKVIFAKSMSTVTASFNSAMGDVQLSQATATVTDTVTVTVLPKPGYQAPTPTASSGNLTKISNNVYEVKNITANCTVTVAFEKSVFTVTASFDSTKGNVHLSVTTATVTDTVTVTMIPGEGYIGTPSISSGNLTKISDTVYEIKNITANCTVTVNFAVPEEPSEFPWWILIVVVAAVAVGTVAYYYYAKRGKTDDGKGKKE